MKQPPKGRWMGGLNESMRWGMRAACTQFYSHVCMPKCTLVCRPGGLLDYMHTFGPACLRTLSANKFAARACKDERLASPSNYVCAWVCVSCACMYVPQAQDDARHRKCCLYSGLWA